MLTHATGLVLALGALNAAAASNLAVTVSIDVYVNPHAIDPRIHGVSFGTPADLKALNAPLNRSGGNTTTTYNWRQNASNHDFDYFFESLPDDNNRSTRQLWDSHYFSESYSGAPVNLIPVLKGWVSKYYYAGTPVAVTEYNWGDEGKVNGATIQVDIYGIFGREGLDRATGWTVPAANTPTFKAMQIYRNYDGMVSGFGDVSVKAAVPNPDRLSAFAAQRTIGGALTVMVVSKIPGATPVTLVWAISPPPARPRPIS